MVYSGQQMAVSIRDCITTINVTVMDMLATGRLLLCVPTEGVCLCVKVRMQQREIEMGGSRRR